MSLKCLPQRPPSNNCSCAENITSLTQELSIIHPSLLCHPQQPGCCLYLTVLTQASQAPWSPALTLSPSTTVLRLPVPETLLDNRPRPWHLRTCCFEFVILMLKLFSYSEADSSSRTQADLEFRQSSSSAFQCRGYTYELPHQAWL